MSDESTALSLDAKWRKICSETLNAVHRNPDAWIFHTPVIESPELSHEAKVAYSSFITEPMDLRTVKRNIPAYQSPDEFEKDMLKIFSNCSKFNKPGQDAFEMGRDLCNLFMCKWERDGRKLNAKTCWSESVNVATQIGSNILDRTRKPRVLPPLYDAINRRVVEQSTPRGSPLSVPSEPSPRATQPTPDISATPAAPRILKITKSNPIKSVSPTAARNASDAVPEKPPKPEEPPPIHKGLPESDISWRSIIAAIFSRIKSNPNFSWFQYPVHEYPTIDIVIKKQYYAIIRNPMDLQCIQKNLPLYPSPGEMRRDLELIVTNSVRFNPPESIVNMAARELQASILNLFDVVFGKELFPYINLNGDWIKAGIKKIPPTPPGPEIIPPLVSGDNVRIKRTRVGDEGTVVPPDVTPPQAPKPPPVPSILLIDRPMAPIGGSPTDWRFYANYVLTELNQIRDEASSGSGSRLTWIFQKPIYKYELPLQIKRLYLLSIPGLIDLNIIQGKIDKGIYNMSGGPVDFENDMERMFDNCLVFNDESQYPHKVGFILQKHFKKYWFDCGLRDGAMELWRNRGPSSGLFQAPLAAIEPVEYPNWEELRQAAANDLVKPGLDCDHISSTAPVNDELLYEWRVAQRYVLQELKNKMRQQTV
jgi:hypothetical protein